MSGGSRGYSSRGRRRCVIRGGQRASRGKLSWPCLIGARELRGIAGGLVNVLHLGGDWGRTLLAQDGLLGRNRPHVHSAASSVVADARVIYDRHVLFIHVVYHRNVHIGYGAVIVEPPAVPVAAIVAAAGVSEAVIDTAVETDVRSPISPMQTVAASAETPVGRSPERADVRRHHPRARNPVITGR